MDGKLITRMKPYQRCRMGLSRTYQIPRPFPEAFKPAVERCRIVPGELPGTAGVVGAVATYKNQMWGDI